MSEPDIPDIPAPDRPARWKVTAVISGVVAIQIANFVASASIFALIAKHPLWLVLLQPTTKNLLLVATEIMPVTFFAVAILRRQVPHPLWFLIGRWYGNASIQRVAKYDVGMANMALKLEQWFPRYGGLLCVVYPHPVVCALAGASSMSFGAFMVYTFIGIIFYVSMAWQFGDWLSPVTHGITTFSSDYIVPLTAVSVAIVGYSIWMYKRQGKLKSVHQIEDELETERNNDEA